MRSEPLLGSSFIWLVLSVCACASSAQHAHAPAQVEAPRNWLTQLDRQHPLVGEIWDVVQGRRVSLQPLRERVQHSELVLVGESHDNADHHRLEAELIDTLAAAGRKPAVVFEMLELGTQDTIDRTLAEHPGDVDGLASAVAWESSGWPPWSLYRPVFASAIGASLPLVAAGLDRSAAMQLAREGLDSLPAQLVRDFDLRSPLAADVLAQMRQEMRESHCGLLPEAHIDSMVLVQRARDALLAERLHSRAVAGQGGVLIAGNGHVRRDRGVPAALQHAFKLGSLAIGLLEVQGSLPEPASYAEAFDAKTLPFDYVWFTPRASDEDHCAELREQMAHPKEAK